MSFPVFDPTEGTAATSFTVAPRPGSLAGASLALLDNGKPNSDRFLAALGPLLAEALGGADFFVLRKPASGGPAPAALLDDLARRARAVVTGVGD
jgi:hypothetical protein